MRGRQTTNKLAETLFRHWEIILALQGKTRGLTVPELVTRTGIPRATLYRYLRFLERANLPFTKATVNGEVRHRLMMEAELPPHGLSSIQVAALHLARTELEHLAGSSLVGEIDKLLAKLRPPEPQATFSFARAGTRQSSVLSVIERALAGKQRLRLKYRARARRGEPEIVHVDPEILRVADRVPYLYGHCVERGAARTYKLSRIESAEATGEPAATRAAGTGADPFKHSRKAWVGEATSILVRLDSSVAHIASEHRLAPDQEESLQPGGSVLVQARIAGIMEALPWVLGWGAAAEVLEPAELRMLVTQQLAHALARYTGPRRTKASAKRIRPPAQVVSRRAGQTGRRVGA